jgi:hypothetical protein
MFWYDLKLWQIFKSKNTQFGKIYALSKKLIYSNLIIIKHMTYWGNFKYNK